MFKYLFIGKTSKIAKMANQSDFFSSRDKASYKKFEKSDALGRTNGGESISLMYRLQQFIVKVC